MAVKLLMPKIGLNMVEGQITEWVVKEGAAVKKGDVLYVVETDKVTNDVEAPEDGILIKIFVNEGEVVPVRKIVGVLIKPGEDVNLGEILEKEEVGISNTVTMKKPRGIPTPLSNFSTAGMQVMASPLVKRMAAEKGIDLTAIIGSGPGGRIMAEDLDKAEIGGSIKNF